VPGLAAQVMRGVADHADVDAVAVMGVEEILQHYRAAVLAPGRPVASIESGLIIRGFFRRVDMGMPVDDHPSIPLMIFGVQQCYSATKREENCWI
jgi:hypothetical protein